MAVVAAFHSKLPGTSKHHNNDKCTEGNNIESYNKVSGTGAPRRRGRLLHRSGCGRATTIRRGRRGRIGHRRSTSAQ
jgi:hypothetical protein